MAAHGVDIAIGEDDVAAVATVAAADARAAVAARGVQAAVAIRIGDGQAAVVVLLHPSAVKTAFDCVFALQLDGHVTRTTGGNSSASASDITITARAAHVDVHVLERDIGGLIFCRRDGDSVGCRGGVAARLEDDGGGRLLLIGNNAGLADVLASVVACRDLDAAVCKVIFLCKGSQRQVGKQQQRQGCGQDSLLHVVCLLFYRLDSFLIYHKKTRLIRNDARKRRVFQKCEFAHSTKKQAWPAGRMAVQSAHGGVRLHTGQAPFIFAVNDAYHFIIFPISS